MVQATHGLQDPTGDAKPGPKPEAVTAKANGGGTEVAVRGPSVISQMAEKFGMDRRAFEMTIRKTVFPTAGSNEDFAAFLLVARDYDLNPLLKEIHAFPKKGGGIQPIVGIDGWLRIINRHPQMDGISFKDHLDGSELIAITCTIHRKDRGHPIEITEYLAECKRNTDPWNQMPHRQLRHKTAIQCGRYAFGITGILDPDEFERGEEMTLEHAPPRPTREQFVAIEAQPEQAPAVTDVEAEPVEQTQAQPESIKFPITDLAHNVGELESAEAAHEFIRNQFVLAEKVSGEQLLGAWDGNAVAIGLIREVNPKLAEDLDAQFRASTQVVKDREQAKAKALADAKAAEEKAKTAAKSEAKAPQPITKVPDPVSPLTLPKSKRDQAWGPYASWFLVRLSKMPAAEIDGFLAERKLEWEHIQHNRQANADAANMIIDVKKNPPKD